LGFCWCTHFIEVKANELIEMFFIDNGHLMGYDGHSVHLSGYKMALIASNKVGTFINLKLI
jgi:hypothetical protein